MRRRTKEVDKMQRQAQNFRPSHLSFPSFFPRWSAPLQWRLLSTSYAFPLHWTMPSRFLVAESELSFAGSLSPSDAPPSPLPLHPRRRISIPKFSGTISRGVRIITAKDSATRRRLWSSWIASIPVRVLNCFFLCLLFAFSDVSLRWSWWECFSSIQS